MAAIAQHEEERRLGTGPFAPRPAKRQQRTATRAEGAGAGSRTQYTDEAKIERLKRSGHRDHWQAPMALIFMDEHTGPPIGHEEVMVLRTHDPQSQEPELTRRARWAAKSDAELRAKTVGTKRTLATEVYNAECRKIFRFNYPGLALRITEDVSLSCPLGDSTTQPCHFKTNDLRLIREHFNQFPLHETAGTVKMNRCYIRYEGEERQLSAAEQVVLINPHPATLG